MSILRSSALLAEGLPDAPDARVGFWLKVRLLAAASGVESALLKHAGSMSSLDSLFAEMVEHHRGSMEEKHRLAQLMEILFSTLCADSAGVSAVLADGTVERGSHALVTLPVGVLQSGAVRFEPPLPNTHRDALNAVNPGRFEKVILRYEERWWSELGRGALRLGGTARDLPLWIDFSAPAGAPTLIGLCGGGRVDALLDGVGRGRVTDWADSSLRRMVGRTPPAPLAVHVTGWRDDPFTRGAYSSLRPGAPRRVALDLAAPHAGRALFAGEHASINRAGTVDGALLTGVREACRLLGRKQVLFRPLRT